MIAKVLDIENMVKNHNVRLSSQEKINQEQTDDILLLKSRAESHNKETEKTSAGRVKRLISEKLAETRISSLPPYPDNPDIVNRRGK